MTPDHGTYQLFHSLHRAGSPLVLPNAWDVASALIVASAGAPAVATTSAGVAWSLGAADGDALDRDRAVDVIARIAAAVDVPVTADIEAGYAAGPDGVAETLELVAQAGAAGVNLEDTVAGRDEPLRPVTEQAERIAAARQGAGGLFINARVDVFMRGVGDPAGRVQATVDRAAAYLAAGADGIFVPGVDDPATIAALSGAIDAPLNVLAGAGGPTIAEFAKLGVARVSVGPFIATAAYAVVRRAAEELLTSGTYAALAGGLGFGELNSLARGGPAEGA